MVPGECIVMVAVHGPGGVCMVPGGVHGPGGCGIPACTEADPL